MPPKSNSTKKDTKKQTDEDMSESDNESVSSVEETVKKTKTSKTDSKTKTKTDKEDLNTETKADTKTKSKSKTESKVETNTESKAELKAETKVETKVDTKMPAKNRKVLTNKKEQTKDDTKWADKLSEEEVADDDVNQHSDSHSESDSESSESEDNMYVAEKFTSALKSEARQPMKQADQPSNRYKSYALDFVYADYLELADSVSDVEGEDLLRVLIARAHRDGKKELKRVLEGTLRALNHECNFPSTDFYKSGVSGEHKGKPSKYQNKYDRNQKYNKNERFDKGERFDKTSRFDKSDNRQQYQNNRDKPFDYKATSMRQKKVYDDEPLKNEADFEEAKPSETMLKKNGKGGGGQRS